MYSVSKYIQIQSAGADNRQMIKLETDTAQPADEDGTQSGQAARTDADESRTR